MRVVTVCLSSEEYIIAYAITLASDSHEDKDCVGLTAHKEYRSLATTNAEIKKTCAW